MKKLRMNLETNFKPFSRIQSRKIFFLFASPKSDIGFGVERFRVWHLGLFLGVRLGFRLPA